MPERDGEVVRGDEGCEGEAEEEEDALPSSRALEARAKGAEAAEVQSSREDEGDVALELREPSFCACSSGERGRCRVGGG